jgi:TetR/AcrR family transcriptional regulator, transcriptional repressor of bet genes
MKRVRQGGRAEPGVRRQQLIDATLECLAEFGHSGTTVRLVCARAGVSPGMVIHYFKGIDDLVATSYAHMGASVAGIFEKAMIEAGDDPLKRLRAVVDANFRPPVLDRDRLSVWLSFWSLVPTNDRIRMTHGKIYRKYRRLFRTLIERIAVSHALDLDIRQTVFGFTAMIEGLWLQLCLEPSRFSIDAASRFAHSWIDAMVDGRFSRETRLPPCPPLSRRVEVFLEPD